MKTIITNPVVDAAVGFATTIILEFSDKVAYHDIKFAYSYAKNIRKIGEAVPLSEEDMEIARVAGWMNSASWGDAKKVKAKKNRPFHLTTAELSKTYAKDFFRQIDYPVEKQARVFEALDRIDTDVESVTDIDKVLFDSMLAEFALGKSRKNMKLLYEEMLLHNIDISKKSWYDVILDFLENMTFQTEYGQQKYQTDFQNTILQLRKERREFSRREDLILKKELNISDAELKKLKKHLTSVKGRDDRGIQTMFRITSRNHYTLNQMVDRKANIMITVNSIILSLVIGRVIGVSELQEDIATFLPILILSISGFISVIFAVLAITPANTHGTFAEEEVRNKRGNLLYYGNFHDMHARDYEWGMLQLLNDSNYLYESMIRDLYYLGKTIQRKHRLIRSSLVIFMFGLAASILVSLIYRSLGL